MSVIRAFRILEPEDRGKQLGDMLQLLLAHGDDEFVEETIRMVRHRVLWVIERDAPNHPFNIK